MFKCEIQNLCSCLKSVLCFLIPLLTLIIGLIIGAFLPVLIILILTPLVVIGVFLIILIVSLLIFKQCNCRT
jgi:Positive regulator of sigma(E), RseC/MucC.